MSYSEAIELRDSILRGDIVIGVMPVENWDRMVELLTAAGEAGEAQAWFDLAEVHASGINTFDPDPEAAAACYERAWDAGHGREAGLRFVRTAYFQRMDVDAAKVRAIMDELVADDDGGDAHVLLGWLHFAGYGFDQDLARAAALQTTAAEAGNRDAMFELYVLYSTGQGVEVDLSLARTWLEKAAHAGSARAMYSMGALHAMGEGFAQSDEAAVSWYTRAADLGHGKAAGTLSVMYASGDGAPQDDALAEQYFDLAWDLGYDAWELYDMMGIEPRFEV